MYQLIKIEKLHNDKKKYIATFKNTETKRQKTTKFGASGYEDYTTHKDKERRNKYIQRHKKDLKTNDYTRAGYLSAAILWSKPTLKEGINFYKKLLNDYYKHRDIEKLKKAIIKG